MSQATLIQPPEQPASPAPLSDREAQRATLRDLVTLATECTATENEIERRFRIEIEAEKVRDERSTREIARKYSNLREQIKQAREQAIAKFEGRFRSACAQLKSRDADLREKLATKYQATVGDVEKKQEEEIWESDSVLENEQNGALDEAKKAQAEVEAQIRALDGMEQRAISILKSYGVIVAPPAPEDVQTPQAPVANAAQVFEDERTNAEQQLAYLADMSLPKLFVGATPYLAILVLCVIAGVAMQLALHSAVPQWDKIGMAVGGTLVVTVGIGFALLGLAKSSARANYEPFLESVAAAKGAASGALASANGRRERRLKEANKKRQAEVDIIKAKYAPFLTQAARKRDSTLASIQADYNKHFVEVKAQRDKALAEAEAADRAQSADVDQREQREVQKAREQNLQRVAVTTQRYEEAKANLRDRLNDGLAKLSVPTTSGNGNGNGKGHVPPWSDPYWKSFVPPKNFTSQVRFGDLTVDLRKMADAGLTQAAAPKAGTMDDHDDMHDEAEEKKAEEPVVRHLEMPAPFLVPAALMFPRMGSLLIQTDRESRPDAIRAMQMVMFRLLTTLPAGRVRFTIIDPIGRGENFAGFMRLADHDDALIGGRIWTEQDQIEQRLADMTEHMETVIQKYLRNEYETIDAYNAQAGELAEPYRILVIADFPTGFEGEAAKRLASICSSGARCGVYTLVMRDMRQPLPTDSHLDEVERNSVNMVREGDRFIVKEDVYELFPLTLDSPPPEALVTGLLDKIGAGAKLAKRVELAFNTIAPSLAQTWSMCSASELVVPVGRSGATKLQNLRIGRGVAQHVLIAGKTGSGKSTLLHAMVTNLALWYSPDEVEFYLVDFKKGVEFKTYAVHRLPHARAIAVESDREFGLSVLQRLDAELTRRGNLFRAAGTQDVAAYRASAGAVRMPRTLLMIDEFQEFFSEDDRVAQDAGLLIDRLVRQGRAFGMHVLLGSQTIGGSSGLARSTIGQMAVRIALMTSEADSQLILGDNNSAARLLSRPGEAIYNDGGGLTENNSPFQVAWLPDPQREEYLDRVHQLAIKQGIEGRDPLIVFEGNAPADVKANVRLMEVIDSPVYPIAPPAVFGYLGDPVAIKEASASTFRRQAGSNLLIIGQNDEAALAIFAVCMISIAAQQAPGKAIFYVFDGTPADSSLTGEFNKITAALPHEVKLVDYRQVAEAMNEIAKAVADRQAGAEGEQPSIYIFLYGLQRYRMLRKTEESFSFGASDTEKVPEPDKQFLTILKEGPSFGIHTMLWADTPATLDRTLDRATMREFDSRILFQMSQNDSSNLIDSPAGNKLGQNRALIYSEEQGQLEKFRPYAIPDKDFLDYVKGKLAVKRS